MNETMDSLQKSLDQLEDATDLAEFSKMRGLVEPQILRSRDPLLICQLGAIYREWKLWREAEDVLQKAVRLEPSLPNPYRSLGLLFIHRDDLAWGESLERARRSLEEAVRVEKSVNDPSAATHTLLGRVYFSLEDRNRAESEFRAALSIDPRYTEATYNLATTLGERHDPPIEEIVALLKHSVEDDPHYFVALRDLGWQLRHTSLAEAEYYLSRALHEAQDDVLAHIYYARIKFDSEPAVAEEHYQKAIALDPADGELHRLLGLLYMRQDRPEDANRELFSAIELDPNNEASVTAYIDFLQAIEAQARDQFYSSVKKHSTLPDQVIRDLDGRIESHWRT